MQDSDLEAVLENKYHCTKVVMFRITVKFFKTEPMVVEKSSTLGGRGRTCPIISSKG